jgi:hypothetical protein
MVGPPRDRLRTGPLAALGGLALAVLGLLLAVAAPAAQAKGYTSYVDAPAQLSLSKFTFGQAPVFMPDGRVLASDDFGNSPYNNQTYVANQDGSGMKCLTCELGSENLVPAVRPQGDWVLFHSWGGDTR